MVRPGAAWCGLAGRVCRGAARHGRARFPFSPPGSMIMVCEHCVDQQHEKCRRGNWCDCQHRVPLGEEVPSVPSSGDQAEAA